MFTGIVEELGEIAGIEQAEASARLRVHGPLVTSDAKHGDSIAVNGVCLTVVDAADGHFTADVIAETLDRSSLGALAPGSTVNLERSVPVGGRLSGHIVQGHVDATSTVLARHPGDRWEDVWFELPASLARFVAEKGAIAIDGISLTVCDVTADRFSVSLIPTTLDATTLGGARVGDTVNLEADVIAKYTERLLLGGADHGEAAA
ncbi:MAG TPA: riboflavin synthase [Streptosporangiaceae bacterium]|jgi:riboflavin synthase